MNQRIKLVFIWRFFSNLLLLIILVASCEKPTEELNITPPNPIKAKQETEVSVDTSKLIQSWKLLKKEFINIDSSEAFNVLFQARQLVEQDLDDSLIIQKIDLNKDNEEELFVRFKDSYTTILQRDSLGIWQRVWLAYSDQYPKLITQPFLGVKTNDFYPCSHCSISKESYYKIKKGYTECVFSSYISYGFDHETDSIYSFYESAHNDFTFKDNFIVSNFYFSLDETVTETTFFEDSAQIVYIWDEEKNDLVYHYTVPQVLGAYIFKWKKLFAMTMIDDLGENMDSDFILNDIAFRAYLDYKKEVHAKTSSKLTDKNALSFFRNFKEQNLSDLLYTWGDRHSFISSYFYEEYPSFDPFSFCEGYHPILF